MLRWNKNKKGFTLVELVIVIAILGILALYALPKYQGVIKEARSSEAKAQLGSFRSALGIYYAKNHGVYPSLTTVQNGDIFADGTVPEVEVTLSDGSVSRSAAVNENGAITPDGDGDATDDVGGNGGWVYDDGSSISAANGGAYSKADVRINSKGEDPANPGHYWYEY